MPSPLTVTRNDYKKNPKASAIYTPPGVATFLYDTLKDAAPIGRQRPKAAVCRPNFPVIFDPAIGTGRLTDPWREGRFIVGCDIENKDPDCDVFILAQFEKCGPCVQMAEPDLVLCNPPFNGAEGNKLYPEVFLAHIFRLFGPTVPTVMFMPMGFRLNQRRHSKRFRWCRDSGAKITSIISLPLDTFPGVEFHSEILVFNIRGIQPHYFLPEEALQ